MDKRWREIERIYHAALERDKSARPAFLMEVCAGDKALRERVEFLLAQDERAGNFLESPAIEVMAGSVAKDKRFSKLQNPELDPGTMVAHYRVTGKIGSGGMGEVYRARDTKLQRDVALKILPQAMSRDPQRMARFEREAQVLASLNHTNIAAIYGLEESNGIHALVMELAEGETLAERIAGSAVSSPPARSGEFTSPRGGVKPPLQIDDALPIAKQISEALEYAHERGVIHRDLKPANVKITPEGTVKVLDFGLAKVMAPADSSGALDPANSPTLTAMATRCGMILGTAAYMSPEQAKGKQVDRRCDIWAFGCVLYEMLAGRKAFEGETITDVLAAVLTKEPDWNALPAGTPTAIQKLIRRCLVKDAKMRLRDIGDARIAIEETLSGADVPPVEAHGQEAHASRPLRSALPWVVGGVFFVIAAVLAFMQFRASSPPQSIRSIIPPPANASFAFNGYPFFGAPILSPDGTRLVFPVQDASGKGALWVRPLDSSTPQLLRGTEGGMFPFWSPDSRQLGFFQDGKLKKIDVSGGPAVVICDAPRGQGGTWNRDNIIVFAPGEFRGLLSVSAAGGTPTPVTDPREQGGLTSWGWPFFLPDGQHFLYQRSGLSAPGTQKFGIYVGKLGSNEQKFLLHADSQAIYSAPGFLLFLKGGTLMAQRFDAGSQKVEGEGYPLAEDIGYEREFDLGFFSTSQTGLLVCVTGAAQSGWVLAWVDTKGKEIGKVADFGTAGYQLSPDGKRLVYVVNRPGEYEVWLMDLERGVQTRFTFGGGNSINPVWSPDGSRIAYASSASGSSNFDIYMKKASGAGNAELLLKSGANKFSTDWSRDGRYILLTSISSGGKASADIWVLPLYGDRKPFPYLETRFNEQNAVFSPDGHLVAYQSNESGTIEIYLSPFPARGGKWQVSQGGGRHPAWKRDGSVLYYHTTDGRLMGVRVKEKGSDVEIGAPRQLFQMPDRQMFWFSVAPDGNRILVNKRRPGNSLPLALITNWTAQLEK